MKATRTTSQGETTEYEVPDADPDVVSAPFVSVDWSTFKPVRSDHPPISYFFPWLEPTPAAND